MPRKDKATSPKPGRGLFLAMLVLCVGGLLAAAQLTRVHVRVYLHPGVESFCAFNEQVNCDTVALSDYSILLGVPVSVWGIVGYVAMGAVAAWGCYAKRRATPTGMLLGLVSISVLTSAFLGIISGLEIQSVCVLCLTTYVTNLALFVLCILLVRGEGLGASLRAARDSVSANWRRSLPIAVIGAAVVGLLLGFYPRYWVPSAQAADTLCDSPGGASASLDGMATGVTKGGHHWIGAAEPRLVIEEFSDYECSFCGRAHWNLRALVRANPDRIRLVHRHFPLDNACNPAIQKVFHPRACAYAALAACAGAEGKFWQANDYLYEHRRARGPFRVPEMAKAIGVKESVLKECLETRAGNLLQRDLTEGIKLRIYGTPTFRINGKLYMGELPKQILEPYVKPAASAPLFQ